LLFESSLERYPEQWFSYQKYSVGPMIPQRSQEVAIRLSGSLQLETRRYGGSCSTCDIIGELTEDLKDVTPQVEAIYIEHLIREHDIQP